MAMHDRFDTSRGTVAFEWSPVACSLHNAGGKQCQNQQQCKFVGHIGPHFQEVIDNLS